MTALIVTEHEWERGQYRTSHSNAECRHVRVRDIVARDVPFASTAAGWPCETCVDLAGIEGRTDQEPSSPDPCPPAPLDRTPVRPSVPVDVELLSDRPNRYAGKCVACDGDVAAGAGLLGRRGQGWVVAHSACPAVRRVAVVEAGSYAIVDPRKKGGRGPNGRTAWLLIHVVARPVVGKQPAELVVRLVVGCGMTVAVDDRARRTFLETIAADPAGAARAYQESGYRYGAGR